MMRSLSSAVGGLRSHQTRMDVIGNNIANVNTYGFKSSRVTFADVYYQTTAGASSAGATTGGSNPTQIGYGAAVATIDTLNQQAGNAATDSPMDLYISGDGFFAVKDPQGNVRYTRLGTLRWDGDGNLLDHNGNFVLGLPVDERTGEVDTRYVSENGTIDEGALVPVKISSTLMEELDGISIGKNGEITGILKGGQEISLNTVNFPGWLRSSGTTGVMLNSLGASYTGELNLSQSLTALEDDLDALMSDPNFNWILDIKTSAAGSANLTAGSNYSISYDAETGEIQVSDGATPTATIYYGTYKKGSDIILYDDDKNEGMTIVTSALASPPAAVAGATSNTHTHGGMEFGQVLTLTGHYENGTSFKEQVELDAATLALGQNDTINIGGVTLTLEASITASDYFNSTTIASVGEGNSILLMVGNVALAKFNNNSGLEALGDSYYRATANTGTVVYTIPGLNNTGETVAGYLEMSNVDISKEFTDMITTQRGFQANGRIITVSDEMLQELVNLKR